MADPNKYFSNNNVIDIIEIFENYLERYDVRIPDSDAEMIAEEGEDAIEVNQARIYGDVFNDLEGELFDYFERLQELGTIRSVVYNYDEEIKEWDEEEEE